MKTFVGWTIECTDRIVWVNSVPVNCGHKHRTPKAAVDCVVKRLTKGTHGEATLRIGSGLYEPKMEVVAPEQDSGLITVEQLKALFEQAGLKTQMTYISPMTAAEMLGQAGPPREMGPATMGTVLLSDIVRVLNEDKV